MPALGEIKTRGDYRKIIWASCVDCGEERWVQLIGGMPKNQRCCSCSNRRSATGQFGTRNRAWKGGLVHSSGYVYILKPEHPRAKSHQGYVKRAILVLEQKLGRALLSGMDSHHLNGIRDDDRAENLEELNPSEHQKFHRKLQLSRE